MPFHLFHLRPRRFLGVAAVLFAAISSRADGAKTNLLSLAGLQEAVSHEARVIKSFRIEGVVCAVVSNENSIVLQDDSAAVWLTVPCLNPAVCSGEWVAIEGNHCPLTRTPNGVQLGTAPVADNDGAHSALTKSGRVFLDAGFQPIRVLWFNGVPGSALKVEYEGPEVPKQIIPAAALWHQPLAAAGESDLRPGVHFTAYEGDGWFALPDFSRLRPVAAGIATNINTTYQPRPENSGLVFDGYIRIDHSGVYTFYLTSDDGSRLYAGDAAHWCKIISLGRKSAPPVADFESASPPTTAGQWIMLDGEVTFAGRSDVGLELELSSGTKSVQAVVMDGSAALGASLLHQHVRAMGICRASSDPGQRRAVRMIIPGEEQLQFQKPLDTTRGTRLTSASQIQRLELEQARKNLPVSIKGIVTQVSATSLVLQDSTGGVFISYSSHDWAEQPRIGEYWEVEGATDPGGFSPVVLATGGKFLGNATLPEPIQATRDQLMNGSLDAQYIEIHGVVLSVSDTGMVILMRGGKINVGLDEMRRFYVGGNDAFINIHSQMAPDDVSKSYVGSVVRVRGCVAAVRNLDTRQVKVGETRLVAAVVSVEQPRPVNPFALPARRAADLLLFDPSGGALQRAKVVGQIVNVQPHKYLLQDGKTGFRATTDETLSLHAGDLVEAVGFPQLGGPSLLLLAAQLHQTGKGPMPAPVRLSAADLSNRGLDSTRVEIEAMLLSDTPQRDERVLELQAGLHHFLARLHFHPGDGPTLLPGSRLQLTGVYSSAGGERGNESSDPFELLLNTAADIVVLQQPSWWTVRHTVAVMAILVAGLGMALIWVTLLQRKVEERTKQLQVEIEERQLVEQHRAIEQERTRVAQDLHDELGAGLTEVSILGSLANTRTLPPETKEGYIDQLANVARSLVATLDEIVWAVNPQYDSVASLATYYSLFAQRFLSLAGIACRPQVSPDIPEHALDSKVRHGLFRAFKEALNNVVRHSGATEVQLVIRVESGHLALSVIDNGRGFKSLDASPGKDGLTGMFQRMQKLGGDCHITSQPGLGTTVELRLPLNPIHHGQSRNR